MFNSYYLGSHHTKNVYILFLALMAKKLEFTIRSIINVGPATDFFKISYFLKAHSLAVHMALKLSLEAKVRPAAPSGAV